MGSNRTLILSLYRKMLRESRKFDSYIYREYAWRRIREAFRQNMNETNEQKIRTLIEDAQNNLQIIQRQTLIGSLYPSKKLVVEDPEINTDKLNHPEDDHRQKQRNNFETANR
nr:LYR motif-containing protein 4-like isoform X1 [Dermatophagoides farinae]